MTLFRCIRCCMRILCLFFVLFLFLIWQCQICVCPVAFYSLLTPDWSRQRAPLDAMQRRSALQTDSDLRWDLQNCTGGSVTRTVTGQWVKMGCCLPGPSNPGITGNQPVWKRRDIVMLSHQRMGEPREARCLNLLIDRLVGALRGGLGGGCSNILKQFNSVSLHNPWPLCEHVSEGCFFFSPHFSLHIVYQPEWMLTVIH